MDEGTSDDDIGKNVEKYKMVLNNLERYLPFLEKVIESSCQLNIEKDNLEKLRILYKMIKSRKLMMNDQLYSCQRVVENLFDKYHRLLTEKNEIQVTNDSQKLNQSNEDQIKTKSSEMKLISNKNDEKLDGKFIQSSKTTILSFIKNKSPNNIDYIEHANEPITDSLIENSNCTKIDLPEFSDSRLRLNKVIGFAANASIEKLDIYDTTTSHTDLAKQIFDEISKHKNNTIQNMLKGINMNDIDINDVKEVIESLKKNNTESIQPVKLPPSELIDLKTIQSEIIPPIKPSGEHVTHTLIKPSAPQLTSSLIPNKTINIREKLNSDIDIVHKMGSSNVPNKQFITALKPGTLIDLENSKIARSSLYIESHRPVNRPIEKCIGIKPSADIAVSRDPRIRKKSLLCPINPIEPIIQMNVQQPIPVPIIPNNNSNNSTQNNSSFLTMGHITNSGSQQDFSHNILSGYNEAKSFKNLSTHTNMQPFNKQLLTEHGGNLNQSELNNYKLPTQHQYKHNYNDIDERYRVISNRDPRTMKNSNYVTSHEPIHYSYKKHREAKLANEKQKEFTQNKKDQEYLKSKYSSKTITDTNNLYNSFGVLNESSSIKNFKIPKIKRKEDTVDKIKVTNKTTEIIKDNADEVVITKMIKDDSIVKYFDTEITENKINKDKSTEIVENINMNKDLINEGSQEIKCLFNDPTVNNDKINIETNHTLKVLKKNPKKNKKYSNEKEFEKIVKEAVVQSLNNDFVEGGPRPRTRSSLKKKEETMNNKNKTITDNKNDSILGECSKNLGNKLNPSTENLNASIAIKQNVTSSTSKESTDVDSSIDVVCESHEDLVSSSGINFTADDSTSIPKCDDSLLSIFRNPGFLSVINYLHENPNQLNELVKNTNIINKSKNIEHLNNSKRSKSKKRLKSKKKKKRKPKKCILGEHGVSENKTINNTSFSHISDNDNLNKEYNDKSLKILKTTNPIVDLSEDNKTIFENDNDHSSIDKPKSNKYNSNNDEILKSKYSCKAELKDLKIIITKYDKGSDDSTLNIQTNIQTINQPIQNEIQEVPELKPRKKTFLGPLSVKLAKQKKEVEQNNSHDNINKGIKLKTNKNNISKKKVSKCSRKNRKNTKKGKIIANVVNHISACIEEPYVVLESIESISPKIDQFSTGKHLQKENDLTEQNSNKTTIEPNVNDIKSGIRKPKMTELDKLHADISENCAAVLNVPNIRHCRTNKQIDYVNTNINFTVLNTIPSIKQNVDVKKSKAKKKAKNITFKSNKKHLVKKNNTKDITVNNSISNKKSKPSFFRPSKFKKAKSKGFKVINLKNKQLINSAKVNSCEISQISNQVTTERPIKVLTENDYKDKLYFQTANNSLECKFCYYNDTGLNIVRHYKELHSEKEVLPSRLSKNDAELLINESLKENYGYGYFEDSKLLLGSVCSFFTCVFCQVIFYDFILFYDHITSHTGEYRYKCVMCSKTYPNENELEKHILEHSVYITSDDNKYQLHPGLIQSKKLFGYLCSFCFYVQLSYINIEKHMSLWHEKEDQKFNGRWTVLRISMSAGYENCDNTVIDYTNLVGCLPPAEDNLRIFEPLIISNCKQLDSDVESKKNEVNVKQETVKYSSESNICQVSPKLSISNNSWIKENSSDINYIEYTLKDNIKKYTVANLSCELIINSVLLYKCSVSRCALNQFSTVILMDFFKHIELNHQRVIWDNMCDFCVFKIENIKEEYDLKDALNHLVSHHLVLKNNDKPNMSNVVDLVSTQDLTIITEDTVQNTTDQTPLKTIRIRKLPGDTLSVPNAIVPDQAFLDSLYVSEASNDTNSNSQVLDLDETLNGDLAKEIIIKTTEQLNTFVINSPFEESADQTNFTTDLRFPILDPPIVDVGSLNELNVKKAKTSIINQNNGITMWMKVKTQREVVLPNSNIFLEPGQQIVNNGQPIHGTYFLIDTEFNKYYSKKVKEFPLNLMKTRLALSDMLNLPRLLGLFKCMDRTCTKIFSSKDLFILHMKLHFSNSEKTKKNQTHKTEQFKNCAYCYRKFEDEVLLANHIAEKYTFSTYFCPYCFYRAYTASHVLVHQSTIHSDSKSSILKLKYNDVNENSKEILMAVDFNEFVLPYVCNVGHCTYSCYIPSNFVSHLLQEHQQCHKFCCYICAKNDNGKGFFALQPRLMMKHFKVHNINLYQCIFCIFGTEVIDSMIEHLAMEHFEYEPICVERSLMPNCHDVTKIENLKVIKVQKVIDNGIIKVIDLPSETNSLPEILLNKTKKKCLKSPDVLTSLKEPVHIDNNTQSLDTIVITVPDRTQMENTPLTPPVDTDFIMLDNDTNQNVTHKTLQVHNILSESKDKTEPDLSNDDVIIIDDDDDDDDILNTSKNNNNSETSKKQKRLALPIISLNKLFVCKECDLTFSTSDEFHNHLWKNCPFWNSSGRKCTFCNKSFKTVLNLVEHSLLHGPDRLKCSLCSVIVPSRRAITHHMKIAHSIYSYKLVPTHSNLTDINKDEFIAYQDTLKRKKSKVHFNFTCSECSYSVSTKKLIHLHMKDIHNIDENNTYPVSSISKSKFIQEYKMQIIKPYIPQQQFTSIKRKLDSNNIDNKTKSPKTIDIIEDKTKSRLLFSPDTIHNVPKSHIFSEPIGCLLCSYITKVRSNLILHLNGHEKGEDNTSKEIVNPVPSIGKSELMFDKMINLSASSFEAMTSEKMRIDEINLKIVEISHQDNLDIELYPKFIPKKNRFQCSMPCSYICATEDMLKKHISSNHQDKCYLCPHCKPSTKNVELNNIGFHLMHHGENLYKCQYCDYIDFNKDEMKIHMRHVHLLQITSTSQSNIIVIRRSMLKDDIIERYRYKAQAFAAQWICNICSSGIKYTEKEITSHIFMVHKISNMFKCPMCEFEHNDDNAQVFEDHYKSKHPSVAVKCLKVFENISHMEELPKQAKGNNLNIQEQQALESIEPTLMSTCRGIPVDSVSISKSYNKSRGVSKSPKKLSKTSPVKVNKKKTPFKDDFKEDDSLGTISTKGSFECPKCKVFETMNVNCFREHLYKEINYKMWRCSICFETSNSPKKMAWHVKSHAMGYNKYVKVENEAKFKWVERVILHQNALLHELANDQNKITDCDNESINSPLKKKKNNRNEKKLSSTTTKASTSTTYQFNNDIINLLDDSDNE